MTFNPPPQKDGWGDDVKKEPQKSWAMWFQNVWLWIQNPTAPTQTPGDNTTAVATDAFVQAAVTAATSTLISAYFAPINNTGASADLSLGIGQSAYIDVSAATSTLLHISTGDNQIYELMLNSTGGFIAGGTTTNLQPNNTAYGAVFAFREVYGTSTTAVGSAAGAQTVFYIDNGGSGIETLSRISTATNKKHAITISGGSTTTTSVAGVIAAEWADTTTAWTSLGTVVFQGAWTGRVTIRRIQ